ncbi:hypothetical protein PUNSTDRAFT_118598 [Punctularia strigosozonata HHB-11173 SS5]|uniref:uncharacterized protein n=1 Tax=Punctularia strigosozonata (strain HHB-11173) TaxID=741275 RepID=UPI0004417509|nr:uncharacterized protein PUNSTDRAFT_118598 [Punctularia strigosozonata HHB-11173 SS5]EIN12958.1 hypothetical protein PUNSTDRAFT_118598 [Punctularia strigosozonata HHB-11173 SS5]
MSQLHPYPHARHPQPQSYASSAVVAAQQGELDTSWFVPEHHHPATSLGPAGYVPPAADASQSYGRQQAPSKPRKKKIRERIALDDSQPPTTQGKPRQRVFLACVQCRNRKVRCDGARPNCYNCSKRAAEREKAHEEPEPECSYDAVPKRRGPDRDPGARQRVSRSEGEPGPVRRRRRKPEDKTPYQKDGQSLSPPVGEPAPIIRPPSPPRLHVTIPSPPAPRSAYAAPLSALSSSTSPPSTLATLSSSTLSMASATSTTTSYGRTPNTQTLPSVLTSDRGPIQATGHVYYPPFVVGYGLPGVPGAKLYDEEDDASQDSYTGYVTQPADISGIAFDPSLNFARKTWWDALVELYYAPEQFRRVPGLPMMTASQRNAAATEITMDLRFIFRSSNYWFSFLHVPRFFAAYFDSSSRAFMQPSLILSLLAVSTLIQSSEIRKGRQGREKALRLREEAQGALEASINAGWLDVSLVQAAWLIAMFESCPHPWGTKERAASAMKVLDGLIRTLALTSVDIDAVQQQTQQRQHIASPIASQRNIQHQLSPHARSLATPLRPVTVAATRGCRCAVLTLGANWEGAREHTPLWLNTPAWDSRWSESEIRREECRRICWTSATLTASHASFEHASRFRSSDLFMADPANFAVMFSGESLQPYGDQGPDTIWALSDRASLLWSQCVRRRGDTSMSDTEKAQYAMSTWLETEAIEEALNRHTCEIEKSSMYHAREILFNTRMCISYDYQRFIPQVFSGFAPRAKAQEWLSRQVVVSKNVVFNLHQVTGFASSALALRPFFVYWFIGQVSRALTLWSYDHSLLVALEVCKGMLEPIEYLYALFPSPILRRRMETIKQQTINACVAAGVTPPSPVDLSKLIPGYRVPGP